MILITGGMAQGKSTFAQSFGLPVYDNLEQQIKTWLCAEHGNDEENLETDFSTATTTADAEIATLLHMATTTPCVMVCAEIGCGIVPLDKGERVWREVTGRTACKLAQLASAVYKMEAGIPIQLK